MIHSGIETANRVGLMVDLNIVETAGRPGSRCRDSVRYSWPCCALLLLLMSAVPPSHHMLRHRLWKQPAQLQFLHISHPPGSSSSTPATGLGAQQSVLMTATFRVLKRANNAEQERRQYGARGRTRAAASTAREERRQGGCGAAGFFHYDIVLLQRQGVGATGSRAASRRISLLALAEVQRASSVVRQWAGHTAFACFWTNPAHPPSSSQTRQAGRNGSTSGTTAPNAQAFRVALSSRSTAGITGNHATWTAVWLGNLTTSVREFQGIHLLPTTKLASRIMCLGRARAPSPPPSIAATKVPSQPPGLSNGLWEALTARHNTSQLDAIARVSSLAGALHARHSGKNRNRQSAVSTSITMVQVKPTAQPSCFTAAACVH